MVSERSYPVTRVRRAAISWNTIQATVAKTRAQARDNPNLAPAVEAVTRVPGPIKAAAITDQNRIDSRRFFNSLVNYRDFLALKCVKYEILFKLSPVGLPGVVPDKSLY